MSFADPQTVTISGTAHTLPRVSTSSNASSYQKDDGTVTVTVSHIVGKRFQRRIKVTHKKYAADPLFPSQNAPYSMSFSFIVDVPATGYTIAEQKAVIDGALANFQATSGANITKLLGGEN